MHLLVSKDLGSIEVITLLLLYIMHLYIDYYNGVFILQHSVILSQA